MDTFQTYNHYFICSLILGIVGLGIWAISAASLIVNIGCIHFAIIGLEGKYKVASLGTLALGFTGLIMTIGRLVLIL